MSPDNVPQSTGWERKTLEKIVLAGVAEQKRSRRWRIFFMFLFFIYVTIIILGVMIKKEQQPVYDTLGNVVTSEKQEHIAMIHLDGVIAADETANAERLSSVLRQAAAKKQVKGILIVANSPGGSPVQASLVNQTIRDIKKQFVKPVLTAVTDMCASGCYYIVAASDEIYADKSSLVGSIGVISQSFGYADAAKKLGIDPRTYTAGENKDFMNPARTPSEQEVAFLKNLLDTLHQNFIDVVKAGRKDKLTDDPTLFSGLFWGGEQALALGLVDGIATPQAVAQKIGNYPVFNYDQKSPLDKIFEQLGIKAEQIMSNGVTQVLRPNALIEFR